MTTNSKPTTQRTRRAAAKKSTPAIDPNVKPDVESFDPNIHTQFRLVQRIDGTKHVERRAAQTAMVLGDGLATQPTDSAGNVIRTKPVVEKSDERLLASVVELLRTFPETKKSWVIALRHARWTRAHGIVRSDGSQYVTCDQKRWRPIFASALVVAEQPVKKPRAKRTSAPKPVATKPARKSA